MYLWEKRTEKGSFLLIFRNGSRKKKSRIQDNIILIFFSFYTSSSSPAVPLARISAFLRHSCRPESSMKYYVSKWLITPSIFSTSAVKISLNSVEAILPGISKNITGSNKNVWIFLLITCYPSYRYFYSLKEDTINLSYCPTDRITGNVGKFKFKFPDICVQ